jgi:hypothetical protein
MSRQQWQAKSNCQDISVGMYSFGAPKPGNWMFSHIYDKIVPNSFRVVVDGDIVSGLPPTMGYQHIGTQVVIDKFCSGSIIVDPSFVERRLRTSTKTSVTAHILALYRQSLVAVRDASMYIQQIGVTFSRTDDSSDGREEFNRAQQEMDNESDDHFFLEKIYGLLNKTSSETTESPDDFVQLPQESGHSIDDSGQGSRALMDVSIRGSAWRSSSLFGYDDTFTLNTSEHDEEENDDEDEDEDEEIAVAVAAAAASADGGGGGGCNSSSQRQQSFDAEEEEEEEEDASALSLSNITSHPVETVLNIPFYFAKKSNSLFQKIVLGVENIRVPDDQVENMMLLQRSAMQRKDCGGGGGGGGSGPP